MLCAAESAPTTLTTTLWPTRTFRFGLQVGVPEGEHPLVGSGMLEFQPPIQTYIVNVTGGGETVSWRDRVIVRLLFVAATVSVYFPGVAVAETSTVSRTTRLPFTGGLTIVVFELLGKVLVHSTRNINSDVLVETVE